MKYNITETEKGFAALQTGITVYIANAIANYEAALEEAKTIIGKNQEEIKALQDSLEKYEPKKEEKK